MPEPGTRTEYSIAAPGLRMRERVSRVFAEALAAVVPGARVVVRYGRVVRGRRGAALHWSRWEDAPEERARESCALCGAAGAGSAPAGAVAGGVPGTGREKSRMAGGAGTPRAACSVVFAPAGAAPYVFAHEWVHRSPALVLSGNGVRVEIDLECLPPGVALGFIGDLRAELEVFAAQWADWAQRAAMDRAGPYPIPPLIYGARGESRDGGPGRVRDDVPGAPEGGA